MRLLGRKGLAWMVCVGTVAGMAPAGGASGPDPCHASVLSDFRAWQEGAGPTPHEIWEALTAWNDVCHTNAIHVSSDPGNPSCPVGLVCRPSIAASENDCGLPPQVRAVCEILPPWAGDICAGQGSTLLGYTWVITVVGESVAVFDPGTSGTYKGATNDVGAPVMIGEAAGPLGTTLIAIDKAMLRFGPLWLPGDGAISPECALGVGLRASFSARADIIGEFVGLEAFGTLCAIPC